MSIRKGNLLQIITMHRVKSPRPIVKDTKVHPMDPPIVPDMIRLFLLPFQQIQLHHTLKEGGEVTSNMPMISTTSSYLTV